MDIINEKIQMLEESLIAHDQRIKRLEPLCETYDDQEMKVLEEFLDTHPHRCRYQYIRSYTGKKVQDRFCGAQTEPGSKFCRGCQGRKHKDEVLRMPPCPKSKYYIFEPEWHTN